MSKLNRLFLDQKIFGFAAKLFGRYHFSTDKINDAKYDVVLINKPDMSNSLQQVNLLRDKIHVMTLNISETENYKTLCFEIQATPKFNLIHFSILFKFFYQYVKQNTNYEYLIVCTNRYQSYIFRTFFGFSMIGWHQSNFFLEFKTRDSLENVWDQYYGTGLEENLYNFLLPVEAGGYVPGHIKLKRPKDLVTAISEMRTTEKRFHRSEKPRAEIKIGYASHAIAIRDLSESGLSFLLLPSDEHPEPPPMEIDHIYNIWITDAKLNISWAHLAVKIVWQKDGFSGCRIVETSPAWIQFIRMMDIKQHQRLTFIDKFIE